MPRRVPGLRDWAGAARHFLTACDKVIHAQVGFHSAYKKSLFCKWTVPILCSFNYQKWIKEKGMEGQEVLGRAAPGHPKPCILSQPNPLNPGPEDRGSTLEPHQSYANLVRKIPLPSNKKPHALNHKHSLFHPKSCDILYTLPQPRMNSC